MNDLPLNLIPHNQRNLERVEQGESFSTEVDEVDAVDTDKVFQFYVYPFTKMEERTLTVKTNCTCPTFGLKLARDLQYGQAYIIDIDRSPVLLASSPLTR